MTKKWLKPILALLVIASLNVVVYLLLASENGQAFLRWLNELLYLGAFGLALVANLTVLVPIPYNAVILAMTQSADLPWLIALAAALGSVLGEVTGFLVGKTGRDVVKDTRFTKWLAEQMQDKTKAAFAMYIVSLPPNPAFDVAGITAGAAGLKFRFFAFWVFLGRFSRFMLFVFVANNWLS